VNKSLVPKVTQRLADLGMDCKFHPQFALDPENDAGLLPIRWKVSGDDPAISYRGMNISTGFEIYIDDFDYNNQLSQLQRTNKPGFFNKLLGKKQDTAPQSNYLANEAIDKELKRCSKMVTIAFSGSSPPSALRVGVCFAAVLAEITNGVLYDPQADEYARSKTEIENIFEIPEYDVAAESPFEGWE
jgi:hypothetical protein